MALLEGKTEKKASGMLCFNLMSNLRSGPAVVSRNHDRHLLPDTTENLMKP